jgi:hypothetical protein
VIRTRDPLSPRQVRYQTALRSEERRRPLVETASKILRRPEGTFWEWVTMSELNRLPQGYGPCALPNELIACENGGVGFPQRLGRRFRPPEPCSRSGRFRPRPAGPCLDVPVREDARGVGFDQRSRRRPGIACCLFQNTSARPLSVFPRVEGRSPAGKVGIEPTIVRVRSTDGTLVGGDSRSRTGNCVCDLRGAPEERVESQG